MAEQSQNRRSIIFAAPFLGVALAGCSDRGKEKETGAVEDLMREHGVLRRAILVFRESAARLRGGAAGVDPRPLADTARLFRSFGEDYHERKLEEAYIFPAVRKAGGPAASLIDTLLAQHNRGRDITNYILDKTAKASLGETEPLARAFESLERMYANHTAREDTILFPAWKMALSGRELDEMGDKFEDIEKQTFGKDGFDDAVERIGRIESAMGLGNLAEFNAPPPPAG